jgi:hypothetical protein
VIFWALRKTPARKHQPPPLKVHAPHGTHRRLHFSGLRLNHSYADCDVAISPAKMKEHDTAGITLMKNCWPYPATI